MSPASMTTSRSVDFHAIYKQLLWELLGDGHDEVNSRTGASVRVLRHPFHFNLDMRLGLLPVCGVRRTFPATAAAEVAWFLLGTKDPSFIREYAPIWDKFVEDDGTIAAAYGYRWREAFGRDQIKLAVEALSNDPSDRRVWVSAWDPAEDGLGARGQKNVPCPVGFSLSIVDGHLNSALVIRSSDVFVGLPYDVMGHALLMQAIAKALPSVRKLGCMSVTLAHPHLYGVHHDMAVEALQSEPCTDTRALPDWAVEDIEDDPHRYVAHVKELFRDVAKAEFHCRPEVVA